MKLTSVTLLASALIFPSCSDSPNLPLPERGARYKAIILESGADALSSGGGSWEVEYVEGTLVRLLTLTRSPLSRRATVDWTKVESVVQ